MRRRTGPIQQWVDSIPCPSKSNASISIEHGEHIIDSPDIPVTPTEPKDIPFSKRRYSKLPSMTVSAPINVPISPAISGIGMPSSLPHNRLVRDPSIQSDSSHCSSVESLLELRRADPEAILLGLGFGGCSNSPQESGPLSRIPKRFLQPSKLKGIAINDFMKQQQESSESFDSVSLGYRGLTGSPYVAPSEIVQKIMDRLRENESHETDVCTPYNNFEEYSSFQQNSRVSVLSPDNRQFLEQPRSRSPDMRNKRMIIGQKSFAFGCDGDLIEISSDNAKDSPKGKNNYDTKENVVSKKIKKLSKQLSFEDESPKVVHNSRMYRCNSCSEIALENTDMMTCTCKQEEIASVEKRCNCLRCSHGYRRASNGSCNVKILNSNIQDEEQHINDGLTQTGKNESSECLVVHKRKSFKRQSRISDADMIHCNVTSPYNFTLSEDKKLGSDILHDISDILKDKISTTPVVELYDSVYKNNDIAQSKTRNERENIDIDKLPCSSKTCEIVEEQDDVQCTSTMLDTKEECSTKNQNCCYNDKLGQICRHDKDCKDCCCHAESTKCWKNMEKIMQENKKLEDMVVKSRREMAVIRDMLNSVLSVRMEPGF